MLRAGSRATEGAIRAAQGGRALSSVLAQLASLGADAASPAAARWHNDSVGQPMRGHATARTPWRCRSRPPSLWTPADGGAGSALGSLRRASSTPAPSPPPSIQVSTLDDFRALLQRSISRPQLFVVHAPSCGSDAALSGALDSLGTRAPPLHLADASAPALAPLVAQLQLSALPGRALAFGGRLVDGLAGPAAEKDVRDWLEGVLSAVESTLERQKGGDEQGKGETRALDPKAAVEQAWALVDYFLNAPSSPAAAVQPSDSGDAAAQALQALQGVLPEGSGATDAQRASALAGVACLVALGEGRDLDGARGALAAAKKMVAQDKLPSEVARAEACCELLSARAVGEARSLEELQSAAQQNAKDPEVWHELALAHFARGNAPAAIESALKSVRADRGWREGAARTLLLQVCSALGRGSQASKTATARLANILFV